MTVLAVVLSWYVVASVLSTCVFLTGLAAYRRGHRVLPTLLAAVLFPATWTVWYLAERPLRMA